MTFRRPRGGVGGAAGSGTAAPPVTGGAPEWNGRQATGPGARPAVLRRGGYFFAAAVRPDACMKLSNWLSATRNHSSCSSRHFDQAS